MSAVAPLAQSRPGAAPRWLRVRSDAGLAERFAAGDEAAFAVLYERHRASVLSVCMGVLGSRHDAEDAAQEAFASLAVALRQSPPREIRAWLVRVARNAAIDHARRRKARPLGDEEAVERIAADPGVRGELESVLAGIRELPELQRTALLMRELGGHTYQEIATLLDTDQGAVRGLIARARIGLREYRAAAELPCDTAREALALEPDARSHDRIVRRHVRRCEACQAYRKALRADARALRALAPLPAAGLAGGGAAAGLAAKGALTAGTLSQVGAACAVSLCSVGGVVLLYPHHVGARHQHSAVVWRDGRMSQAAEGRSAAPVARGAATGSRLSGSAAGTGPTSVAPRRAAGPLSLAPAGSRGSDRAAGAGLSARAGAPGRSLGVGRPGGGSAVSSAGGVGAGGQSGSRGGGSEGAGAPGGGGGGAGAGIRGGDGQGYGRSSASDGRRAAAGGGAPGSGGGAGATSGGGGRGAGGAAARSRTSAGARAGASGNESAPASAPGNSGVAAAPRIPAGAGGGAQPSGNVQQSVVGSGSAGTGTGSATVSSAGAGASGRGGASAAQGSGDGSPAGDSSAAAAGS